MLSKSGAEPIVLLSGTVVGVLGDTITQVSEYDPIALLNPSTQAQREYIALLRGSATDVTKESSAERTLRDRKILKEMQKIARDVFVELRKLRKTAPDELVKLEEEVKAKAKRIKNDGLSEETPTSANVNSEFLCC